MFNVIPLKKRYKRFIFGIYSAQKELQHATREIFLGIKRVENITDDILTNFRKDFIVIRLERYYFKHKCLFSKD